MVATIQCYAMLRDATGKEIGERQPCTLELEAMMLKFSPNISFAPAEMAGMYQVSIFEAATDKEVMAFAPVKCAAGESVTLTDDRSL